MQPVRFQNLADTLVPKKDQTTTVVSPFKKWNNKAGFTSYPLANSDFQHYGVKLNLKLGN
jgi:hypothetical protein